METDKFYEIIIEIKTKLSSIDTKVDNVMARLENHEHRINSLESTSVMEKKDWKSDLILLLTKTIMISMGVIGSLAGASGIIKQILAGG